MADFRLVSGSGLRAEGIIKEIGAIAQICTKKLGNLWEMFFRIVDFPDEVKQNA